MWGIDFLYYLPAPVQGAFILLSVFLFIPGFRRQIRSRVGALPLSLWGEGRRVWLTRGLLVLVALSAFFLLSSARHFLGDGYYLLNELDAGTGKKPLRAPFTFTLIRALHCTSHAVWETAENTYRVYSYTSGLLYVLLAFVTADTLGKNVLQKSIVLAFLLTTGYMQLFFGYVENYALYMPGFLLYILLGLRAQEQRTPLYGPALLLGLLLALHPAFVVLGPSLLFLAYRAYRQRQENTTSRKNAVGALAALCCVPLSATVFLELSGVGYEAYSSRMGGSNFLPLFGEPGFDAQYPVFSYAHLFDFLNQQLLAAPTACMALFLLSKTHLNRQPFLAICAAVPLLFTFVANPGIGAVRDWDIFSLPALPLTLLAAAALVDRIRDREELYHVASLLCGSAALHTCLWVVLNASAGMAETRFVHLTDRLTGGASANSWVAVGNVRRQEGRYAGALYAYKRALDSDPKNPNRWMVVGAIYREMGKSASAVEFYEKAAELLPDHAIPYMNLGAAYSDLGQYERAIEYTRKAVALQPDNVTAQRNLGGIYIKAGQAAKSIEHLEKAAALRPDHAATHGILGDSYREAGKNTRAIKHFEKSIALRPLDTGILVNLSVAYIDEGHDAKAIEVLKRAVELQPNLVTAYVNLGVVYSRIGEYATGITYLKKSLEIQSDHPTAHKNLGLNYRAQGLYRQAIEHFEKALESPSGGRDVSTYLNMGNTYYDMREHEKAIPFFQKAVGLNPNHANAHLLLGLSYRALNRGDRARVHFEKTLELEPNHPQAAQIRTWLEQACE